MHTNKSRQDVIEGAATKLHGSQRRKPLSDFLLQTTSEWDVGMVGHPGFEQSVWMDCKLHKAEVRLKLKGKLRCGSPECLAKS